MVGRLAGADKLPAAERQPGKSGFRDLLQNDPHGLSLSEPGHDPRLAHAEGWLAKHPFPGGSDTVT